MPALGAGARQRGHQERRRVRALAVRTCQPTRLRAQLGKPLFAQNCARATAPTARATRRSARPTSPTRSGSTAAPRRPSSRASTRVATSTSAAGTLADAGVQGHARRRARPAVHLVAAYVWGLSQPAGHGEVHAHRAPRAGSAHREAPAWTRDHPASSPAPVASRRGLALRDPEEDLPARGPRLVRDAGAGRWCSLTQIVFYGLPWLVWNGRQAVLFDLAARKFYIFGLVLLAAGRHLPRGRC